jgi:hypothetical protein
MEPTLEVIMSTNPCADFSRERVAALLAQYGPFDSWVALAERAREAGWPVPLSDLRLTAYRVATPEQCRRGVVHSTHSRVLAQIARWPEVSAEVRTVRESLLAWTGDREEIRAISDASYSAYCAAATAYAYAYAANAAAAADAYAYAYAAYAADAYAADAYAAEAACEWDSLLFICRVLDGVA